MQARKSGIAPVMITVAVIALVAIAAVAGYVLLSKGPASSSSVQTTSSSSTATSTGSESTTGTGTSTQSVSTTSATSSASASSTSSGTSSTTSSTVHTFSSTTASSSNACATNTTTPSEPASPLADLATLLGNYSQLSMAQGTSTGSGVSHSVSSYSVAYASTSGGLTTYKVQINSNASGATSLAQAWITSDGTVTAFNSGGSNETGAQAQSSLSSSAAPFLSLIAQGQLLGLYTSSPQVQPVNQTGVMLGPTSLYVTNFAATTLPAVASTCTDAYSFTSFSLQAVAVSGTDIILVTQENIQGTDVSGSGTAPVYAVLQITSLIQA